MEAITSVIVGTTHATNAVLEQKELYKVGVIRIAGQFPESPPPCFGWPQELSQAVLSGFTTVAGGFECHGSPIRSLDVNELKEKILSLSGKEQKALLSSGCFLL